MPSILEKATGTLLGRSVFQSGFELLHVIGDDEAQSCHLCHYQKHLFSTYRIVCMADV